MRLHTTEVGQPYRGAFPPEDSWQYNFRGGQHELVGFILRPKASEVREIRSGRAEFALVALPPEAPDAIALALKFGSLPWSDAIYSWHLVPEGQRVPPRLEDLTPTSRALVPMLLVDRGSRIILAGRGLTFSPEFTRALHAAIREQAARPWPGETEYGRQLQALYARYPSSEELAAAATVRCVGGE